MESFIVVIVVGLNYQIVEYSSLLLIYTSVHSNCVVPGNIIKFDNNENPLHPGSSFLDLPDSIVNWSPKIHNNPEIISDLKPFLLLAATLIDLDLANLILSIKSVIFRNIRRDTHLLNLLTT